MSKYGEPWYTVGNRIIASKNGFGISITDATSDEWRKRAVACVNAMMGVEDPEQLMADIRKFGEMGENLRRKLAADILGRQEGGGR